MNFLTIFPRIIQKNIAKKIAIYQRYNDIKQWHQWLDKLYGDYFYFKRINKKELQDRVLTQFSNLKKEMDEIVKALQYEKELKGAE